MTMYLIEYRPEYGIAPEIYIPERCKGRQEISNKLTWIVQARVRGKGFTADDVSMGPVGFFHSPIYSVTDGNARHIASARKIDALNNWEE